jgi:hypothetical protein
MFLNKCEKDGNVISKTDGYYASKDIQKGDELMVL